MFHIPWHKHDPANAPMFDWDAIFVPIVTLFSFMTGE